MRNRVAHLTIHIVILAPENTHQHIPLFRIERLPTKHFP
jgi:hypothetical protein